MKNARYIEQLRVPTLAVVSVHVAHMWRAMPLETEDQAPFGDLFRDPFGLVFGGAIVESVPLFPSYFCTDVQNEARIIEFRVDGDNSPPTAIRIHLPLCEALEKGIDWRVR